MISKGIQHFLCTYIYNTFLKSNHQQAFNKFFIPFITTTLLILTREKVQTMAIHHILRRSLSSGKRSAEVPKGHVAIYVGDNEKKRFLIPVAYLNHPSFQELLFLAEEEFGFNHLMGGLTIPCSEDSFVDFISGLSRRWYVAMKFRSRVCRLENDPLRIH